MENAVFPDGYQYLCLCLQSFSGFAEEMEAEYRDAFFSGAVREIEGVENTETTFTQGEDYDPSAEGESLEMFISYFDSWYQYGDLNAMNIRLYGEGTWEIYNSLNSDKTGGYFFDSGTFTTLGTTALKLVNGQRNLCGRCYFGWRWQT